jgi:WD40 repeat protein
MVIYDSQLDSKTQVECGNKVVAVIWDPLRKYVCGLTLDNKIFIYNMSSKSTEKTVDINMQESSELAQNIAKEDRLLSFSPDLNYLLIPSLDDRKVPHLVALSRKDGFKVTNVFGGPFGAISCCSFYPQIFKSKKR